MGPASILFYSNIRSLVSTTQTERRQQFSLSTLGAVFLIVVDSVSGQCSVCRDTDRWLSVNRVAELAYS